MGDEVDWQVGGIEPGAHGTGFWLRTPDGTPLHVTLALHGAHNALNAAAAIAALAEAAAVDPSDAAGALADFAGTGRRYERRGAVGGAIIVDDYAHHPTEVAAVIAAARAQSPGRVVVCFQPHLYSRTSALAGRFGRALAGADEVVVTDVYPARERPVAGVTGKLVVDAVSIARPGMPLAYQPALDDGRPVSGRPHPRRRPGADRWRRRRAQGGGHAARMSGLGFLERELSDVPTDNGGHGRPGPVSCPAVVGRRAAAARWADRRPGPGDGGGGAGLEPAGRRRRGSTASSSSWSATWPASSGTATGSLCGGGASLAVVVKRRGGARRWPGVEFCCAIPGTAGGAVRMNAGRLRRRASGRAGEARVVIGPGGGRRGEPDGLEMTLPPVERRPGGGRGRGACCDCGPATASEIRRTVREMQDRRRAAQPQKVRTFGSVWKNPSAELTAGRLLEQCGLKGYAIGGARISPVHANFIENTGGAHVGRRGGADGRGPAAGPRALRRRRSTTRCRCWARSGFPASGRRRREEREPRRRTDASCSWWRISTASC